MVTSADPTKRGREMLNAQNKCRIYNFDTGEFLHLSGRGVTKDVNYSWLGHRGQANTLKERALARGEGWPFTTIHRGTFEEAI